MPFMKGAAPVRRTLEYLRKGEIFLRHRVKVVAINYNTGKQPHHEGTRQFVFWHLAQLQYNNPDVQFVQFYNMLPTPFITLWTDDGRKVLLDCDGKSKDEIHDHFKKVAGKSEVTLQAEALAREKRSNPANFGPTFARQCICEVPGQVPCPGWVPLPKQWTGKYKYQKLLEEREAQGS